MSDIAALVTDNLDIWTSAVEQKSSSGRGSSKKVSCHGVERLRSLILDLAVRGLLLPQNEEDEGAAAIVAQARKAQAQAIAEKRMRKPKSLTEPIKPLEGVELPRGWEWTRLIDIAEINPKNKADDDADVSFVPMPLVSDSTDGAHDFEPRKWGEIKKGYTHFADGDIALAKITPCFENGKAAIFSGLMGGVGAGTTELHVARPLIDEIERRYLLLNMKTSRFLTEGEANMTGTAGQKRVPRSYFELTPLPLPPLAEQKRIVAKVDELMALCDALEQESEDALDAHQTLVQTLLATLVNSTDAADLAKNWARLEKHFDTLFTTEASIDAFEQTILELAVRGKLAHQNEFDELAPATIRRKLLDADFREPFQVPERWLWASVGSVADARLGKMLDKAKNRGTPKRYLRNANVRWFDFDLSDILEMRFEVSELEEFSLRRGDVLICEGGEPGRTAIWDERESDIYFQKALHRVRFPKWVMPEYFAFCIRNAANSGRLSDYFTGSGIKHFTGKGLGNFVFPVPPLAEQVRIVTKIDKIKNLCDALRARIIDAAETQRHLADTIVERAAA